MTPTAVRTPSSSAGCTPASPPLTPVRVARTAGIVTLLAAVALLIPLLLQPGAAFTGSIMVIWAMVGLSLVVLTGWGGQISLGQFAIVGAASIVAGNLVSRWNVDLFVALGARPLVTGGKTGGLPPGPRRPCASRAVPRRCHAELRRRARQLPAQPQHLPRPHPPAPSPARSSRGSHRPRERDGSMLYFCLAMLAVAVTLVLRGLRRSRTGD